jgi:hypothetical protein
MPVTIENTSHPFTLEIDHTTTPFTVHLKYRDGVTVKMPIQKWVKEGYERPKNAL